MKVRRICERSGKGVSEHPACSWGSEAHVEVSRPSPLDFRHQLSARCSGPSRVLEISHTHHRPDFGEHQSSIESNELGPTESDGRDVA